jgi:hypothetical protein
VYPGIGETLIFRVFPDISVYSGRYSGMHRGIPLGLGYTVFVSVCLCVCMYSTVRM